MDNTEYSFEDMPLGVNEIAEVLGVKPATVTQWQRRLLLPKPDASINKGRTKLWKCKTVIDWANATGRNLKDSSYETAQELLDVIQKKRKNLEVKAEYWNKKLGQWEEAATVGHFGWQEYKPSEQEE